MTLPLRVRYCHNMAIKEMATEEAADMLGVSVRTIRRYIATGKLTAIRYHNGRVRLIRSEVIELAKPVNA